MKLPTTGREMICEWIKYAAATTNVAVYRLDRQGVDCLVATIRNRYVDSTIAPEHLWEGFVDDVAIRNSDGWKIACEYPVTYPILLFRDGNDYEGFHLVSTDGLRRVLSESPGFEFVITNEDVDFALYFNHHDCLIGVGNCKEWLSRLPDIQT